VSKRKMIIPIICATLIVSSFFLLILLLRGKVEWKLKSYQHEMIVMAQYAAALQALHDFERGKLRLYELKEDGEEKYANQNEGPFELWFMPYSSTIGKPHAEAKNVFVEMYNNKMKTMYRKKGQK